jgi:hypothetical protein
VRIGVDLPEDEIDPSVSFIVLPQAIAGEAPSEPAPPTPPGPLPVPPPGLGPTPPGPGPTSPPPEIQTRVHLSMRMTRQQLYASFQAIGNLAQEAGQIRVTIEAEKQDGFNPSWLRNAVLEPLEEADISTEETG